MSSKENGLKPKMYSLVGVNGEENKKANWFNKNVVKNTRHKMKIKWKEFKESCI